MKRYTSKDGVVLIEDFAHHPTAVEQTVEAIREAYPTARLWAVFEPRSNTSRRKVFQKDYVKAFAKANHAVLKNVAARSIDAGHELIAVSELSSDIAASGVPSVCLDDVNAIRDFLWANIKRSPGEKAAKDVVFVMSNGSFDGLNELLQRDLELK